MEQSNTFSRHTIQQCLILFGGICAGLWIHRYLLVLVALYTLAVAFFGKVEDTYYHLLFCLPFTMIYKLSPASTSLFAYVMLAAGVILIVRTMKFDSMPFILIAAFGIYSFVGAGGPTTTIIKMIMGMFLFYIFVKKIEQNDFKNQVFAFVFGMLSSSCIGMLKGSWSRLDAYFSDMNTIYVNGESSIRFTGLYLDPNYYSISVIFAITLCVMFFTKKEGNRAFWGIGAGMLTIFGFSSYSKMFLIALAVVILVFVIYALRTPKMVIATLLILIGAGGAIYNWMQSSGFLDTMLRRFESEDISTGRFEIWERYINHLSEFPKTLLFGDGIEAAYISGSAPHNTLIEVLYFVGILGGILFLLTVLSIFLCKKNDNKRNIVNFVLPILLLIMTMTLGCMTINDLMFYCMLIWLGFNFDMANNKNELLIYDSLKEGKNT